ncbi:MAG: DNA repair protein RecN [Deltaproteobacteria bacterium RBG_19FT_COMBO_43_11]|nr:MAG: DNA repair protein RecN [Deltaproteobacteria bacterium RBG_16_44_11]OGP91095.1 MAG: DNA repair protein RecN [Deltaproteobacteria bacterium RBG_19FT_COMBO_43_11]
MLNDLSIKNFAIIDELQVSFGEGLNIISGETGAGKSIIIGAVSLLLGDRATADMIRTQADAAEVEALFDISANKQLQEKIASMGFNASEEMVIRRIISRTGKNKALINGQMATLANLAAISESLINICGQHEHQVILNADNHIDILDEFGGCLDLRAEYLLAYNRYMQIREQIEKLENLRRSREEKTEMFKFLLKEISDINPQSAEDTHLADEKKVLVNAQKLMDYANRAYDLLYGEKDSAVVKLKEVQNQVKEIRNIDEGLKLAETEIESSFITLQEAALTLRDYGKSLFFDPERLAMIDERLEMLGRLKRKHGGSLESVLHKKLEIEEALQQVFSVEEELEELSRQETGAKSDLRQKALNLSGQRNQAAVKLKHAVEKEIHELNMPHASFEAKFKKCAADKNAEYFGPKGSDEIEFYLTANAGEEPKPLNKIASGGELSRIVLALKNVLSRTGSVATIIFDEVDNGIGGATAEIVGRKLKEVSANHQVICITHLPQIACYGEEHLYVSKKVTKGRTTTSVGKLDDKQKIEEISRMLGGVDVTETTREHAREMMKGSKASGAGNSRDGKC